MSGRTKRGEGYWDSGSVGESEIRNEGEVGGEFLWELHSLSTSGYIRSRRGGEKQELIRGAVETKKADFAGALKW